LPILPPQWRAGYGWGLVSADEMKLPGRFGRSQKGTEAVGNGQLGRLILVRSAYELRRQLNQKAPCAPASATKITTAIVAAMI
jgi:hypothetical protein